MAKILLCLQFWEGDVKDALDLVKLLTDIEQDYNEMAELLLFSRHDMGEPAAHPIIRAMVSLASTKFKVFTKRCARRGTGHPAGANDMWHDLIQQVWIMKRDKQTESECFLSFEADCCPVTPDWIKRLYEEWKLSNSMIIGAYSGGEGWIHVNGNLVADIELSRKIAGLDGCPEEAPWDVFHKDKLMPQSKLSKLIFNLYRKPTITHGEMFVPRDGVIPAMLHGIRDNSARKLARKHLVDAFNEPQPQYAPRLPKREEVV